MINLSCNGGETLPVTMNILKLRTVRARCVQLPLSHLTLRHLTDTTQTLPGHWMCWPITQGNEYNERQSM